MLSEGVYCCTSDSALGAVTTEIEPSLGLRCSGNVIPEKTRTMRFACQHAALQSMLSCTGWAGGLCQVSYRHKDPLQA